MVKLGFTLPTTTGFRPLPSLHGNITYMNKCLADGIMVYKYIDIVGTSNTVITDAINNAIEEASKTVKNIKWGELGRVTFRIEGKKIEYQAEVRIGFEVKRDN